MTYTILAASFANAEHTAAVISTGEAGAVVASQLDTPDLWAEMLGQIEPAAFSVPPSIPPEISRRQMLLAMQLAGLITDAEALAAATVGAVPAAIDAVFTALPAADALAARVTWATMGKAARHHPLILALIQAERATPEQVDAIFVTGAAIL